MSSQKSSGTSERAAREPRRLRGHKRVSALLDAGAQVFAGKGYDAATMTEIAAAAGASIGSLYQFFATKEQLAAALHARHLDDLAGMLEGLAVTLRGAAPPEVADRLFEEVVAYLEANPAFLVLGERRSLDPAVKKQARARLRAGIAALLAAASPPVIGARAAPLAAVVLHLIRVAAMLRADEDASVRADAVAELRDMLRGHLARAEPGAPQNTD